MGQLVGRFVLSHIKNPDIARVAKLCPKNLGLVCGIFYKRFQHWFCRITEVKKFCKWGDLRGDLRGDFPLDSLWLGFPYLFNFGFLFGGHHCPHSLFKFGIPLTIGIRQQIQCLFVGRPTQIADDFLNVFIGVCR